MTAINFGSAPLEPQPTDENGRPKGGYVNRRAEMWGKSKEWLQDPGGVDIPDLDTLQADACAPGYKYDSLTRLQLESKDDIRKRGLRSPDELEMGGMFTVFKVRKDQKPGDYKDPGPYRVPRGNRGLRMERRTSPHTKPCGQR